MAIDFGSVVLGGNVFGLRAQPVVAAPVASARTVEQLGPILQAGKISLSADEMGRLSFA